MNMKYISTAFHWSVAGCLVLIAAALIMFPGASTAQSLLQMLGILVVTLYCYNKVCPVSVAGPWIILAAWTFLGIGFAMNVWHCTTYLGGTLENPVFTRDAFDIWQQLQSLYRDGHTLDAPMSGFSQLLYYLNFGFSRPEVTSYILFSIISTLLSIVFTGATAALICDGDKQFKTRMSTVAMIMMTCITHFISRGDLITKDAVCIFIFTLMVYTVARICNHARLWPQLLLLTICAAAAWFARPQLFAFAGLLSLLFCFAAPRRRISVLAVAAISFTAIYLISRHTGSSPDVIDIDGTTSFGVAYGGEKRLAAFRQVIPDYGEISVLRKILSLPFTMAVQFLTPLPWSTGNLVEYGPTLACARFTLPWYAVGGIIIFYLVRCLRQSPRKVMLAAVFGFIATAATAYVTGGTVSRYCLLWLPTLVPCAAWVVASGRWRKKDFKIWAWTYGSILAAGLIIVAVCLHIYSPGGWG